MFRLFISHTLSEGTVTQQPQGAHSAAPAELRGKACSFASAQACWPACHLSQRHILSLGLCPTQQMQQSNHCFCWTCCMPVPCAICKAAGQVRFKACQLAVTRHPEGLCKGQLRQTVQLCFTHSISLARHEHRGESGGARRLPRLTAGHRLAEHQTLLFATPAD